MSSALCHAELLDRLRAEIAQTQTQTHARDVLPFGLEALDKRLALGGIDAALHEFAPASSDLAEDAAATLFIAGIAARLAASGKPVVWVVSRFDLYAPGLEQAGLPADRALFVEAREDAAVLAAMEDALRFGAVAAVVGEVRRASMVATRRLQLAAADHGTPALLFRRWRKLAACPLDEPSAATTRWRIGCVPSAPRTNPGVSRARWEVALLRQRNGAPFTLTLEACDAAGCLALPAIAAGRAPAALSPARRAA